MVSGKTNPGACLLEFVLLGYEEVIWMNSKLIIPAISMGSVLVFFIWGYIEGTFQHSWLIFLAAGIAIALVSIAQKNKNTNDGR